MSHVTFIFVSCFWCGETLHLFHSLLKWIPYSLREYYFNLFFLLIFRKSIVYSLDIVVIRTSII